MDLRAHARRAIVIGFSLTPKQAQAPYQTRPVEDAWPKASILCSRSDMPVPAPRERRSPNQGKRRVRVEEETHALSVADNDAKLIANHGGAGTRFRHPGFRPAD